MAKPDLGWRTRYGGRGTEEFIESELAIDPAAANADNIPGAMGRTGTSA
jgi:NADH-quinone oxidoreductase subunit B